MSKPVWLLRNDECASRLAKFGSGTALIAEERLDEDAVEREHGEAGTCGDASEAFVPPDERVGRAHETLVEPRGYVGKDAAPLSVVLLRI